MSISEDMLADKLKGHSFKMSQYQYAEVRSHIDPEMMYIVTETVYNHMSVEKDATYKLYPFFKSVVRIVMKTMCEREKCDITINSDRIESIVWNAYDSVCTNSDRALAIAMKVLPYIINDTLVQIRYYNFK
jgi:hypothetical protein